MFVPGTAIREDRLPQLLTFLTRRTQNAPMARRPRLQRLLTQLTEPVEGAAFVHGINVERLEQLLSRLTSAGGQRPRAAKGTGGNRGRGKGTSDSAIPPLAQQVQEIQAQLQETRQQLAALPGPPPSTASSTVQGSEPAESAIKTPSTTQKLAGEKSTGEWFDDFI